MRHNPAAERVLAVALLILSTLVYGRGLGVPALRANEGAIEAQAVAIANHGGHDRDGRMLPVFVHVDGDVWLPPVPVYATAVLLKLMPAAQPHARWAAAIFGVADELLLYLLIVRCFRRPFVGFAGALVLLFTPTHVFFSRTATVDGIWQVPFILGWAIGMTALTERPSPRGRALFAAGTASLALSTYAQPSAALMMPMFAIATIVVFRTADEWRIRDVALAGAAFVTALLPILVWFARFPAAYPDTFGRWVLHPAHLRNPLVWLQAAANWQRDAHVAALFWDFFSPSHLFLTPDARGRCGMFLTFTAIPMAAGVYALVRTNQEGHIFVRMRLAIIAGCIVPPLAAAMFDSARSDERALVVVPFGILVAVWGATVAWRDGGIVPRAVLVLASGGAGLQAILCLR